jgi:hypothetical protein
MKTKAYKEKKIEKGKTIKIKRLLKPFLPPCIIVERRPYRDNFNDTKDGCHLSSEEVACVIIVLWSSLHVGTRILSIIVSLFI